MSTWESIHFVFKISNTDATIISKLIGALWHERYLVVEVQRVDQLGAETGQLGVPSVHALKLGVNQRAHLNKSKSGLKLIQDQDNED